MARPAFGYRNAAGKKIPGSTSVLKHISTMDSDILLNWAAKIAKGGKDWKSVRAAAGAHGSFLHDLCENKLPNALDPIADKPEDVDDKAWEKLQLSYEAIRSWYVKHGPRVVFAEKPLISERYQFAGTADGVVVFPNDVPEYGVKAGEPWLLDYKTGSFLGAKEIAQMASYRVLLSENNLFEVQGAILIHAPTKEPGFMRPVILSADALDLGWDVFSAGLKVFSVLPQLEEVCS